MIPNGVSVLRSRGLLVVQILAVYFYGIEPKMRSLEEMHCVNARGY
jgi:hypothetical protein